MKIDKVPIRERLQELAGNLKVKVSLNVHDKTAKYLTRAVSARVTDQGYAFNFNPSKIRCPNSLEKRVRFCANCIDSIGVV
ncbi:MAG: hypothetical protein KAR06_04810 [Deltaproteobacteria bacterium]|nr:hypothetical protein [Deltaproteobacteria bacterium]